MTENHLESGSGESDRKINRRDLLAGMAAGMAFSMQDLVAEEKDEVKRPRDRINWKHTYYEQCDDRAFDILIKAPKNVDKEAIEAASRIVTRMLENADPDIVKRLQDHNAQIAIIPRKASMVELPEFQRLRGLRDSNGIGWNGMLVRGGGAVRGQPVTATSEENLLQLPAEEDRFHGQNICFHEFGHAVMNLGFSPDQLHEWKEIHARAMKSGVYSGKENSYFLRCVHNPDEYFAKCSQVYFGVNDVWNDIGLIAKADPDAVAFLEKVYGEKGKRNVSRSDAPALP